MCLFEQGVGYLRVAPLAGSVDRNFGWKLQNPSSCGSLPSRGAWIEIRRSIPACSSCRSLPSRGAWIEICSRCLGRSRLHVAPLTGSVDRNILGVQTAATGQESLPSRGAWIKMPADTSLERCRTGADHRRFTQIIGFSEKRRKQRHGHTPYIRNTTPTVWKISFQSTQKLRSRMYWRSSSIHSSKVSSLRLGCTCQ